MINYNLRQLRECRPWNSRASNRRTREMKPTQNMVLKAYSKQILNEIRVVKALQAFGIAVLHEKLSKIEECLAQLPERLKEAGSRISELDDKVVTMQKEAIQFQKKRCLLGNKID
ncbi:hypothetical protein NDU88_001939 [Pleurodeles waltl]|uniref:Uncharacterized protein n=1 Tax=Pleurodeles waltl TaxID=8319 RepID=A0AAV7KTZ0_PLEWA|nr:hypothetical protein NDU88_001939 [Pleurodeles waltl]